jgi:uncharacterized protein involved in type VI secretion and phage assembly
MMGEKLNSDTQHFNGVFMAVVIENADPNHTGRVKVRLPRINSTGKKGHETWARLAVLGGSQTRGIRFVPEIGDEVLVAFEQGDSRYPYVIGSLWDGTESPPETTDEDHKDSSCSHKVLKSPKLIKSGNKPTRRLPKRNPAPKPSPRPPSRR